MLKKKSSESTPSPKILWLNSETTRLARTTTESICAMALSTIFLSSLRLGVRSEAFVGWNIRDPNCSATRNDVRADIDSVEMYTGFRSPQRNRQQSGKQSALTQKLIVRYRFAEASFVVPESICTQKG